MKKFEKLPENEKSLIEFYSQLATLGLDIKSIEEKEGYNGDVNYPTIQIVINWDEKFDPHLSIDREKITTMRDKIKSFVDALPYSSHYKSKIQSWIVFNRKGSPSDVITMASQCYDFGFGPDYFNRGDEVDYLSTGHQQPETWTWNWMEWGNAPQTTEFKATITTPDYLVEDFINEQGIEDEQEKANVKQHVENLVKAGDTILKMTNVNSNEIEFITHDEYNGFDTRYLQY